ncbi:MAG: TonB-dependent receptor [Hyphomonadaceae bacterium]|nr:TonB-dependent receptor [Hyphomonadaceae bacterium]
MHLTALMRGFAAASILIPSAAFAQTVTEPEIVVTAPLEGARIESLQGADILRRDDIVRNLSGGLGDTLASQPGVSSTAFGAAASRPIIRGLGEDRVRVLQNGIGAIDASTASPDHAVTADGLDAERIEILRGAAALAYGGNAIGGVVNVIDQSIPTRAIDGMRVDALAGASSVDDGRQGAVSIGFGAGAVAFRLGAGARDTDPYDTPLGVVENSWTQLRTLTGGAALVGDWGHAGFAVKHTQDEYGLLPHHAGEAGGHIELEQTRYESRGDFRIQAGPFDRLDYGFQHSDYEHTEFEADGQPGTVFLSSGWEGRLEAHHRQGRLQGAIGVQLTDIDFEAIGEEAFITATTTRDTGVFAVERWDAGVWGIEGGLRFERREIENVSNGARQFENWSGSAGVFFRPAQNWFLGATVARAQRAPSAVELFSDGLHLATESYEIGDSALNQETANSFEASARYTNGPFRLEANIFRVSFDGYIALVERGDTFWVDEVSGTEGFDPPDAAPTDAEQFSVFHFVQRDADFIGGEISASARLFEAGGFVFTADGAYEIVRASFDAGGHPPRIPPATLTLGLEAQNDHWTGRVETIDVADQTRLAPFETRTDGYTLVNAGVSYRPFGDSRLTLRLDGRNLTDELARAHTSFLKDDQALPGRNLRFTVATQF